MRPLIRSQHCLWGKAHQVGATNKAKLEYRDCTRFPQGIQQRDGIDDKGLPWTIARIRRSLATIIGHNTRTIQAPVAERPVALPPAIMRDRDMWITLFSVALAAATCFGATAIILARSKYLAGLSG